MNVGIALPRQGKQCGEPWGPFKAARFSVEIYPFLERELEASGGASQSHGPLKADPTDSRRGKDTPPPQ